MACELQAGTCRREHIARHLDDAKADSGDFEAHCPVCGHGGFRISAANSKSYRHVWTCQCGRCKCKAGDIRAALLKLGILPGCLGIYDGPILKAISPETARTMDRVIRDILCAPHLKPSDMRLALAEAIGWKVPADYTEFVKFAKHAGVGHQQAYEAARRWLSRPSGGRSHPGGGVVDTSRTTKPDADVKSVRSEACEPTETVEPAYGNRSDDRGAGPTETVDRTTGGKPGINPAA